jgi:hypothetical protein
MSDGPLTMFAKLTPQTKERLVVFGAIGLVIVGTLLWALFSRRSRRRNGRREERRHHRGSTAKGPSETKQHVQKRQRRRRRDRRPRNPTLAETGGLPPVRSENSISGGNPIPPH